MPRLAFRLPSIGSRTRRSGACGSPNALPELLGDEGEVDTGVVQRHEALDHRVLGSAIDGRRLITAFAGADHGLAVAPRRQLLEDALDRLARVATDGEPVGHSSNGEKRRPHVSFGKKYVLFGGMRSPARA